jgi:NAD(P)-dependent dehydrogenase (short-subunit alcohol dehydrogenase family)
MQASANRQVIVITGSTRGIGLGLAEEFLKRGCAVVINGRSASSVATALAQLQSSYPPDRLFGHACETSDYAALQALWDAAHRHFGRIDYWINNAGIALPNQKFWTLDPAQYQSIVHANLIGKMNGTHVAFRGMLQQGSGQIFNMEGFGSDGRMRDGALSYGTTKYGLRYFTRAFTKEAAETPVMVGTISPGMVVTDLLIGNYDKTSDDWTRAQRIFNILADTVETVTPWLVERMLANTRSGAHIDWLPNSKIAWRFLSAPFSKRNLFPQS